MDYGLGLEDISGWNNKAGVPWRKFKTSSRDKFINEVGIALENEIMNLFKILKSKMKQHFYVILLVMSNQS